ncbi:hypothetical protein VitviT2T_014401 [Vitis vinifera]|uniref:Protein SLOW GREEN 1, chloroplastic n=2 Tax=Vitis vinifera TaxID=29760 RepID=A0ABY9CLZ2_VITVI|eukprot:XP_002266002.1 PREDICTED: uncharacterized protein LOC100258138 isoform X1 [Vitis vinifera]
MAVVGSGMQHIVVYGYGCGLNRKPPSLLTFRIHCSSDSKPTRGFGPQPPQRDNKMSKSTTSKEGKGGVLQQRKSTSKQSGSVPTQAPGLSSRSGGKSNDAAIDLDFEERLEAVRRTALEQKKADEKKEYGAIDYDTPVESEEKTIGLGTKIGVGVAVVVFGLVFALGDFLPSGSDSPSEEATVVSKKLSEEEKSTLQARLQQYEATLSSSPKDQTALEAAAVTLVELGEYTRAASLLEDFVKEKPNDPEAFRLLGEVKFALKDYEGSAAAYRSSAKVSETVDFEVLRGLTNALLAAKKPDEAVQVLLASRERLNKEKSSNLNIKSDSGTKETESQEVDPVQVELLLGKAYSDWGHISDAVSLYDQLISSHPEDFRGYLAKGIILKENGNIGDAERMFIQARFFAPEKAKSFVDRYSRK